jgi:hypothetical protein
MYILFSAFSFSKCYKMMLQGCNKQAVPPETGTIFSPGFHLSKGAGGKVADRGKCNLFLAVLTIVLIM